MLRHHHTHTQRRRSEPTIRRALHRLGVTLCQSWAMAGTCARATSAPVSATSATVFAARVATPTCATGPTDTHLQVQRLGWQALLGFSSSHVLLW
jgi:hypothetical protein